MIEFEILLQTMFEFIKNFSKKKILNKENIKLLNQDLLKYDLLSIKNHIKNKISNTSIELYTYYKFVT